ncbi:MAG: hypothetical protein MR292_01000 [Alistipes sp.]|nr:hypothetical protein [Alistipes sp.]
MTDDSLYGGRVLLLAAVEDELGDDAADLARRCDLVFTGVGKLRAFEATLAALSRHDYAAVVNVGTCGSLVHRTGTVLRPSEVWQGGLYIDSVFASEPERVASGSAGVSLVTVDNFISPETPRAELDVLARYDCFEMEGYAVLRALRFHAAQHGGRMPRVMMVKGVSDNVDGSLEEWFVKLERVRPALIDATDSVLTELGV